MLNSVLIKDYRHCYQPSFFKAVCVEYCSYKGLTLERPIFPVLEVVMLNIVLIKDLYCACLSIKKRSIATS